MSILAMVKSIYSTGITD